MAVMGHHASPVYLTLSADLREEGAGMPGEDYDGPACAYEGRHRA